MPPPPKRNPEADAEALEWVYAVLGEPIPKGLYEDILKNGVVLCRMMNKLAPGSVKKICEKGLDFKLMENINNFQAGAQAYGVAQTELFQTVDLWNKRDVNAVTKCLFALGRAAQKKGFNGPVLGPKEAEENKREFTEDQLRAGEGHIGLQAGFSGGASQAGMTMGKQRMIQD